MYRFINLEQITQKDKPMEDREQTWFKNAEIVEVSAPFNPEGGAYDHNHSHEHDHKQ